MKTLLAACLLLLAVGGVAATDACDQEGCCCSKVAVDFYAEALCPFCRRFLTEIVADMMNSGFNDIMELRYIPWGNAMVRPNGKTECQHGPMECKLNRVLSCVIHHYPGQTQWFPFADCLEGSDSTHIDESLKTCADSAKMDLDLITTCAEGAEADKLQQQARNETAALQPPHQYVPWVVVNGIALGADYSNLPTYVCAAHRCERPKVCGKVPDDAAPLKGSNEAGVSWPTQVAAS